MQNNKPNNTTEQNQKRHHKVVRHHEVVRIYRVIDDRNQDRKQVRPDEVENIKVKR